MSGAGRICMPNHLSSSDEAQLAQTIEMFEVITQSQPDDFQSLEILKEAYAKLGRESEAISTSKRIAQAYVRMGQLSSAILEYETILQGCPEDGDVQRALAEIETKAATLPEEIPIAEPPSEAAIPAPAREDAGGPARKIIDIDDGRRPMHKIFVEGKLISTSDFDACWPAPEPAIAPERVAEPFVQAMADKQIMPLEKSLRIVSERSKVAFLPLSLYDVDMDLARGFPAGPCRRWCVLPFDRMSKSLLVATANPFNQQAAKELAQATPMRLVWYLVPPRELIRLLGKVFR